MAVEYIELGGEKRPILIGNAAFRLRKQRTGKDMMTFFSDLASTDKPDLIFEAITDITYCALRIGELSAGVKDPQDYDEMKVAMWVDLLPGGIEKLSQMIVDALPKPAAGEGEAEPGEAQQTGTLTS